MVEGGKWVGAARRLHGVAHNKALIRKPQLLTRDAFGEGWMLIVHPAHDNWRDGLVTGAAVGPMIEQWIAGGAYKDRTGS